MTTGPVQYSPIVDAVLAIARNLTPRDFADLALAALDHAGIPLDYQDGIRAHIEGAMEIVEVRREREQNDERFRERVRAKLEAEDAARRASLAETIDRSSVGAGLRNIRENGLDAELADLEDDLRRSGR